MLSPLLWASPAAQLVNYAAFPQTVALDILGVQPAALRGDANVTTLAAAGPYVTNSFEAPNEAR